MKGNSLTVQLDISYNDKYIIHDTNTWFLGIAIDSSLTWKHHIEGLAIKLSRTCYAIRSLRHFVSHKSLKKIYFANFHAVMSYGIIFWGNSPHSISIFKLQKRVIRLITNSRSRDSCRELFKNLDILPFYWQYISSLLNCVIDNSTLFKTNSEVYNINTRGRNNFYLSQSRLST
jgi:hypothetical protein